MPSPGILARNSQKCMLVQAGGVFYRKTGLSTLPMALFNGMPLSREEMDPEELETVLLQRIMDSTSFFQRAVLMVGLPAKTMGVKVSVALWDCVTSVGMCHQGQLSDDMDVVEFLMGQTNVVPRINPVVLGPQRQYLDFTSSPGRKKVLFVP